MIKIFILFTVLFSSFAFAAEECSREWAVEGAIKSKKVVFGLGLSTNSNPLIARDESKQNAIKEVVLQIQSSVDTAASLNETESSSQYISQTEVKAVASDLIGLKVVKEGSNKKSGIEFCQVVKFDVEAAYSEYESRVKALEASLQGVFKMAKDEKYIEVLKHRSAFKKKIENESSAINKADMYLTFMGSDEKKWHLKIKEMELIVEKAFEAAKEKIVFIIPKNAEFESSLAEIESKIAGEGFEVQATAKTVRPVKLQLEIKPIGAPRKTKTSLGITYISKINVSLKENEKVVATNKGAQVIGTGSNDDDALANIDRQLFVHLLGVLNEALPGVFPEE